LHGLFSEVQLHANDSISGGSGGGGSRTKAKTAAVVVPFWEEDEALTEL